MHPQSTDTHIQNDIGINGQHFQQICGPEMEKKNNLLYLENKTNHVLTLTRKSSI